MEGHEEDRVVTGDDVLGAVAVMHVPVDDRDAMQPELRLCPACGDRHVVEQAEPHRPFALGVVPRRPGECESAKTYRLDRSAGREQRSLVGRLGAHRVGVDPAAGVTDAVDQAAVVAAEHVVVGRGAALGEREPLVQHHQPLL